jgi:class 3 adenylate cyclase
VRPDHRTSRPPSPTGENRVCTVMFVDLTEVMSLSARLGAEDTKEIVDRCFALVKNHVEEMGCLLEELSGGDRGMALFGVPRASDNDAERAVLAASRVQASLARLALPWALRATRLSARIGITTGRVFAELTGADVHARITAVGEAVNLASRLQQAAPPGAVVIGRDT